MKRDRRQGLLPTTLVNSALVCRWGIFSRESRSCLPSLLKGFGHRRSRARKRRPLRRQPDDHNFGSLLMVAVTAGAFLLVIWVATKALFFFLHESSIPLNASSQSATQFGVTKRHRFLKILRYSLSELRSVKRQRRVNIPFTSVLREK